MPHRTILPPCTLVFARTHGSRGQGAYLGNGLLGAMVTAETSGADTPALRIDVGRTDVWACANRQPVGYLRVTPARGRLLQAAMRLVLESAELHINLTIDEGGAAPLLATITMFINAADPAGAMGVLAAALAGPACGTAPVAWEWVPDTSGTCSTRKVDSGSVPQPWGAVAYYAQHSTDQPGTYTTALTAVTAPCSTTLLLTVANSQRTPTPAASQQAALATIAASVAALGQLRAANAAWWRTFWTETSFFSFDSADLPGVTRLESFAHIAGMRYAMAARFSMSDLMGPWGPAHATECIGPWCQFCWDMNQQVMLYLPTPSNRGPLLAVPALDMWNAQLNGTWGPTYGSNAPGDSADTVWWLANMHRFCLAYGDDARLRTSLLPGLRNLLLHNTLQRGPDGRLHAYNCRSPEYPMGPSTDCTYVLAIYQWGAQTALAIAEAFDPQDTAIPVYKNILETLAPFPVDNTTGAWELAVGVPFTQPHRHYSHLLQIYDLRTAGAAPGDVGTMRASLDQWWSVTCAGPQTHGPGTGDCECRGFTQAGMAFMSARLNRTAAALGNLTSYLTLVGLPNAMYGEEIYAGQPQLFAPVSESAYSAAAAVYDLLVSSSPWPPRPQSGAANGPQTPPQPIRLWHGAAPFRNATVFRLRCEGVFLISAVREHGRTLWASVEAPLLADGSGAGVPVAFVLEVPDWAAVDTLQVVAGQGGVAAQRQGPGLFLVTGLRRPNAAAVVPAGQTVPQSFVVGVADGRNATEFNAWGSRFVYSGILP